MDDFPRDYPEARQRFRTAAQAAGADSAAVPLTLCGPGGEDLSIDIAWLGSLQAPNVLIHTCGLHGVEGFAGSAVQHRLLCAPPKIDANCALVLIHVLNPYGMAWLRRTNDANVDLNRNFIFSGQVQQTLVEDYARLNRLLNPASPPGTDLSYYVQAPYFLLRYGYPRVKAAIASGQFAFPRGLFYGGGKLEREVLLYHDWLQQNLNQPERMLVIDLHTGLGAPVQESLFQSLTATAPDELSDKLQTPVSPDQQETRVLGYRTLGSHEELYRELYPSGRIDFITHEFGTRSSFRVLQALRRENQWHHYGGGGIEHPTKQALLDTFCPPDPRWRQRILDRGVRLIVKGLEFLGHT